MIHEFTIDRLINQGDFRGRTTLMGLLVIAKLLEFKKDKKRPPQDGLETRGGVVKVKSETFLYELNRNGDCDLNNIMFDTVIKKMLQDPGSIFNSGTTVTIRLHFFNKCGCHIW